MAYIPSIQGYIIDVPNLIFKPDGKQREVFTTLTSASVNNGAENLPINGGQGKFPLAIIPTNKTLEFQFECADFDARLFAKANDTEIVKEKAKRIVYGDFIVDDSNAIDLGEKVADAGSIEISGFEAADAPAEGKFKADTTGATAKLQFAAEVKEGTKLTVTYEVETDSSGVIVKTNDDVGHGELWLEYPVYAGADKGSGIQGSLVYHIFSAYVTALPGFNNSYKQASTFGATFTALDPRRPDKKMYETMYFPIKNA